MISKRNSLSKADFWKLNDGILNQISKIDWSKYQYVHLFLPIKENNEVDTFEILFFFKHHYPRLKIVVPRANFKNSSMENVEYDHMYTVLRKNSYNIPEPIYGNIIPSEIIDAVLVPLLAFDLKGNRVGYGGGFYDRFLKDCKDNCQKIGLSLFEPQEKFAMVDVYDVKLNSCITPHSTYNF